MSKFIANKPDLIVIGGGTSGVMCALGALQAGLKVTLICEQANFASSSLLTEIIPTKTFSYCANLAQKIRSAEIFGLDVNLNKVNLIKVNNYIQNIIHKMHQENELHTFTSLGGRLIQGHASFIDQNTILINKQKLTSKYFIIATGARAIPPEVLNFDQNTFLTHQQIFHKQALVAKTVIIAGKPESLEIAQALARFGSNVTIVFANDNLFPLEDPELIKLLQKSLEKEGIHFYYSTKILEFYWQNKRKLLLCQDHKGNKFAIDCDEIINMQANKPNIERLGLINAKVQYSKEGIIVNNHLQTTQKHIFALGSVIKSPFRSVHFMEHQTNIILSNIVYHLPRSINYQLIPRIINTDPQFASIGHPVGNAKLTAPSTKLNMLEFDFKNIDAAIYQQQTTGKIKLFCQHRKLIGVSILGPLAAELINEYSLAMQVGADLTEVANNIHAYPSISQINKRAAHKIFSMQKISNNNKIIEKAMYKALHLFNKLVLVN